MIWSRFICDMTGPGYDTVLGGGARYRSADLVLRNNELLCHWKGVEDRLHTKELRRAEYQLGV